MSERSSLILSAGLIIGLIAFSLICGNVALKYRAMERTVEVKGLAEHEYPADIIIWPIPYQVVGDNLAALYRDLDSSRQKVLSFLDEAGIEKNDTTITIPQIIDRHAYEYGNPDDFIFRYSASQNVTVYSKDVNLVRSIMGQVDSLGRSGVPLSSNNYEHYTQYLFSDLNQVKPSMIEEATANAREVANKFAEDSNSKLGKIKSARQGQFSIEDRDSNNPHIKRVRVVTTVEYYLAD